MQTPDCATTWSERWRDPLTSPRWLRAVLVFVLLVLGWPLGRLRWASLVKQRLSKALFYEAKR